MCLFSGFSSESNMYGALRKTLISPLNNISGFGTVERRYAMRNINNPDVFQFTINCTLYRANKVVFLSKIGSEGYKGHWLIVDMLLKLLPQK